MAACTSSINRMTYYQAETIITGDVTGNIRCHPTASGVVANFAVEVTTPWGKGPKHTELYKCVAFGRTGADVEQKIKAGQVVTCNGFMRTSEWNDGSGKENHQLICSSVAIGTQRSDVLSHSPPPKMKQDTQNAITAPAKSENRPPVKSRTYGRHSRKPRETDFTAVLDDPFNDELPPL